VQIGAAAEQNLSVLAILDLKDPSLAWGFFVAASQLGAGLAGNGHGRSFS
jgi:hypothetical protein